jgi:hypothetical protein
MRTPLDKGEKSLKHWQSRRHISLNGEKCIKALRKKNIEKKRKHPEKIGK